MSEIGYSGTEIYSGMILEDYNSDLQFPESVKVYDQMRKGDATVGALLSAIKLPIINGNFFVTPASDDKRDIEIAEFVDTQFFKKIVWTEFLKGILLSFDFGFMVFEKVYQKIDDKLYYKRLAQRLPKSIQNWATTKPYMVDVDHPGIEQNVLNDLDPTKNGKNIIIPGNKLFRYTLNQEGENYDGVSILRTAYKHWLYKDEAYKIQAIAGERNGVGLPVAKKTTEGDIKPSEKTEVQNTLKGMRANEKAHIIEPYGWEFRLETANSQYDFDPQILHHDRQITKSALAQFLELGVNKGALSQSKSDQDLFLKSIMAHVQAILGKVNRELVREIVMLNFDNVEDLPIIEVSNITQDDLNDLSVSAQRLAQTGFLTPDDETENHLRRKLKFPERDFEENPRPKKDNGDDTEKKDIKKKQDETKDETKIEKKEEKKDEKKKLTLSNEFKPYRTLTLAEEKMDIPAIISFMDLAANKISNTAKKYSRLLEKQLLSDAEEFLKTGKFPSFPQAITAQRKETIVELRKQLLESFDFGKTQATRELEKQERVKTPPYARESALTSSTAFTEKQTADMRAEAQFTASTGKTSGLSDSEILAAVLLGVSAIAKRQNELFSRMTNTEMINSGRATTYNTFSKDISRYQYSAILDSQTSNICLSLDGRVTEKMTDLPMPPNHANCRSQILAISKEQTEQPPLNPPPKSVVDGISPNPFKTVQPKKPTNIKGSPAKDVIEKK